MKVNKIKSNMKFESKVSGKYIKVHKIQRALDPKDSKVLVSTLTTNSNGRLVDDIESYRVVLADSIRRRYWL